MQNLGVMKNIKGSVPKDSPGTLHKTLVESYLRYCNINWGQYELKKCRDYKTKLQELYLEQALRRVTAMTY